jgi:hypothetical protein
MSIFYWFGFAYGMVGLINLSYGIPLWRGKIKPTSSIGYKTTKSYASEENWYKINAYLGKQMILWAIPSLLFSAISFLLSFYLRDLHGRILLIADIPLIFFCLVPVLVTVWFARNIK